MSEADLTTILLEWTSNLVRLSLHDINRYARSAGLSIGQMTVLLHLFYQGPLEVTQFCEMLQISPAGASQMIERLVQQGVVQRSETPGDRRVRLVELTAQGLQLVQSSIADRRRWLEQISMGLSAEERSRIIAALQALTEMVGHLDVHP
jgi:DNA-binding MarR family transcriptional regulator